MTLQYETLKNWPLPPLHSSYTERDTILYAIGIGASLDPITDDAIDYLYEGRGPVTLPTMATILAQRTMWMDPPELGVEWTNIVHGEQKLTIHEALPPAGDVVCDEHVLDIYDKGPGKGAVLWAEQTVRSKDRETLYATLHTAYFLRGNGGFGGEPGPASSKTIPDRAPDGMIDLPTRKDQAIIYRLSGDVYPLHIDDAFARKVGFDGPILHGLCSYGIAARALIAALCGGDAARLEHIAVRFSAPVYPGETLRTEYWRLDDGSIAFRCRIVERDVIALNQGLARIRG